MHAGGRRFDPAWLHQTILSDLVAKPVRRWRSGLLISASQHRDATVILKFEKRVEAAFVKCVWHNASQFGWGYMVK